MMDPLKTECLGFYLYGTGFSTLSHRGLELASGRPCPTVCDRCPKHVECIQKLRDRVDREHPAEVAEFVRRVKRALETGVEARAAPAKMADEGYPDPYILAARNNLLRGRLDAGVPEEDSDA